MERYEIYKIIDQERKYQDTIRKENERETRDDNEKSISDFILYMEEHLRRAKSEHYHLNDHNAMCEIRKVVALGVAAGEAFDMPKR